MSHSEFATAAAKADVCRLLAACYYEPGAELAEEGVFTALSAACEVFDTDAAASARRLEAAFAAERQENLLVDYARLFLGPTQTLAPPYESAWRDKNSDSPLESVQALVELYDDGGFAVDADFRDLPDHIAVELEFLYVLLFEIAATRQRGDEKAESRAQVLRSALLAQHLDEWIGPFCAAIGENAGTAFYRELGALTQRFIGVLAADR